MLLFENPSDIISLIEAGVPIKTVNVGECVSKIIAGKSQNQSASLSKI